MHKLEFEPKLITAYVPVDEYRLIKSKLALKGLTFSDWLRKEITKFLESNK